MMMSVLLNSSILAVFAFSAYRFYTNNSRALNFLCMLISASALCFNLEDKISLLPKLLGLVVILALCAYYVLYLKVSFIKTIKDSPINLSYNVLYQEVENFLSALMIAFKKTLRKESTPQNSVKKSASPDELLAMFYVLSETFVLRLSHVKFRVLGLIAITLIIFLVSLMLGNEVGVGYNFKIEFLKLDHLLLTIFFGVFWFVKIEIVNKSEIIPCYLFYTKYLEHAINEDRKRKYPRFQILHENLVKVFNSIVVSTDLKNTICACLDLSLAYLSLCFGSQILSFNPLGLLPQVAIIINCLILSIFCGYQLSFVPKLKALTVFYYHALSNEMSIRKKAENFNTQI